MDYISKIIENKCFDGKNLTERMEEICVPAVSFAVIENYEIKSVFVRGKKNLTTNENADENTIFQAASISKPVFAVAVMRLVERGILDLDADISKYTDFKVQTFDGNYHKITLKQLLSHYAGLSVHGFAGYRLTEKIPTTEQILQGEPPANSKKVEMINLPETAYSYSGGGYTLAQKIVTDVCKEDFDDLMQELVLKPFNMTKSAYSQPLKQERISEAAMGHLQNNEQIPGGFHAMPELAAAGLWTNPTDLAKFGIEIMKAINGKSDFMKKETAIRMITPAYENSPTGISFFVRTCQKGITFGHSGSNCGYHSNSTFCPDNGSGFVIMQNSDMGVKICAEATQSFREAFDW